MFPVLLTCGPGGIEAHEADLIRARTAHLGEIQQRMLEIDRLLDRVDSHGSQLAFDFHRDAADEGR